MGPRGVHFLVHQLNDQLLAHVSGQVHYISRHVPPGAALGEIREFNIVVAKLLTVGNGQIVLHSPHPERRRGTAHFQGDIAASGQGEGG